MVDPQKCAIRRWCRQTRREIVPIGTLGIFREEASARGVGRAHRLRTRSPLMRTLVYAALAILAFALAVGVGATGALVLQGDLAVLPERQEPRSADEQAVSRARQEDTAAGQEEAAPGQDRAAADRSADAAQRAEAAYVEAVGDIQVNAVGTFRNSHKKLLRYDSLSAADVEEMEANEAALRGMAGRATDLDPPQKYGEQHDVFASAIDRLHEATRLARVAAADPVAIADLGFDEYDGHVDEASALLRRSNELLGEEYEAIEGAREVSPEL